MDDLNENQIPVQDPSKLKKIKYFKDKRTHTNKDSSSNGEVDNAF